MDIEDQNQALHLLYIQRILRPHVTMIFSYLGSNIAFGYILTIPVYFLCSYTLLIIVDSYGSYSAYGNSQLYWLDYLQYIDSSYIVSIRLIIQILLYSICVEHKNSYYSVVDCSLKPIFGLMWRYFCNQKMNFQWTKLFDMDSPV